MSTTSESATPATGPLIGGLVRLAFEQALQAINGEIAPRYPELRDAHLQVFRFGSIDGSRVTDLAARMGMTKQSMHELVGHLEKHGYVRREPDPRDPRARLIRTTERGRELGERGRVAAERVHLSWRDQLGGERFAALWSALAEITGRADPLPELTSTDRLRR